MLGQLEQALCKGAACMYWEAQRGDRQGTATTLVTVPNSGVCSMGERLRGQSGKDAIAKPKLVIGKSG